MTKNDFTHMLHRLASGWTRADYDAVLAEFDPAVKYGDPTRYSFAGTSALRAFFEGCEPVDQHCVFHTVVFD